jgi:FlaA1/EpsC-like NDP-sugar epimerase
VVKNNVVGTWEVARRAGAYGSDRFVLVSTDKAVRPSSLMGATKQVSERLVLELAERHPDTAYMAVRFGNVLGSQGSVVPLFQRQLEEGGPLTVTHPDVTRYFMTIAEAGQLILQASVLPEARNHVTMLEMGEAVRIDDLARTMLRLSGVPEEEIDAMIEYIGLRPGEKLHEELMSSRETTVPTSAEKIRVVETSDAVRAEILDRLPRWRSSLSTGEVEPVVEEIWSLCDETAKE